MEYYKNIILQGDEFMFPYCANCPYISQFPDNPQVKAIELPSEPIIQAHHYYQDQIPYEMYEYDDFENMSLVEKS